MTPPPDRNDPRSGSAHVVGRSVGGVNTLDEFLTHAARQWPNRPALMDEEGRAVSYRALNARVGEFTRRLKGLGLEAGERVALSSRNSPDFVAVLFAVWKSGGVAVPLNTTWGAQELAATVEDCGASVVFADDELKRKNRTVPIFPEECKDLAMIIYTSGSTDRPLGVMLTHQNLISNNLAIVDYLELTAEDRVSCVLPFYYVYGLSLLLSHIAAGACVFMDNRFLYPQAALDGMEKWGVTGFSGVSSHFIVLMNQTDFLRRRLPKLRYLTHAGDKMPPSVAVKVAETFPDKKLFLMYGQTEAAPRISYLDPALVLKKPASAGKPLAGIELQILNEQGKPCGEGEEGEIVIRGENVMKGYWKCPEETGKVLREGRLYTGDVGYLDGEGDLFVMGRKKQFLKIGGRRVSPLEVESMTLQFAGVAEAAAVGIPDPVLGERLKVCVSERKPGAVNREALMAFFRQKLPLYKVPSEVEVLVSLPKNSQGKVDKKRLTGPLKEYTPFTKIAERFEIREGDILLISSDVLGLVVAEGEHGEVFEPNAFIDSFLARLGKEGTLLLPTFNFDFCDKGEFDICTSSSLTGALSRAALGRPDFRRTRHPIHSFAVWGKYQKDLCDLKNKSSFGEDSPFGFLHRHGGGMLIIGLPYQGSFTFVHYVEEREKAPYRFMKEFEGRYVDADGRAETRRYTMFVRNLEKGVESWVDPIGTVLERKGLVVSRTLNGVSFKLFSLAKAYEEIARDIRENQGRNLRRVVNCKTTGG